jgi:hypothetical protein
MRLHPRQGRGRREHRRGRRRQAGGRERSQEVGRRRAANLCEISITGRQQAQTSTSTARHVKIASDAAGSQIHGSVGSSHPTSRERTRAACRRPGHAWRGVAWRHHAPAGRFPAASVRDRALRRHEKQAAACAQDTDTDTDTHTEQGAMQAMAITPACHVVRVHAAGPGRSTER